MSAKSNAVFNIMPMTFILPKEYVGFLETFSELEDREGKMNYWIIKPAAKSRGRGIEVINDISSVIYGEPMVMQRYLKNPLLLNGYKFDLRIYVLVTNYRPLKVWLSTLGFARFCNIKYSSDLSDIDNMMMHLTNVAIQKKGEEYNTEHGSKWSIENLRFYLE